MSHTIDPCDEVRGFLAKTPQGDAIAARLRWVWHDETFASLMLGRVQLAQISRAHTTLNWFWTLFFCERDEKPCHGAADKAKAIAVAEAHARKVIAS